MGRPAVVAPATAQRGLRLPQQGVHLRKHPPGADAAVTHHRPADLALAFGQDQRRAVFGPVVGRRFRSYCQIPTAT